MAHIGIYGVSSQSGAAFLADLVSEGALVYGYARPSDHGRQVVEAIRQQGGVQVDRPEDVPDEKSHFVPLFGSEVGHDLERLADTCDLIFFTHPSLYHEQTARELAPLLQRRRRRVPIVLSPSRSLAAPYLWQILGEGYPIIAFQTCPYACKCYRPGSVYIKRRKRAWVASTEGRVAAESLLLLQAMFPGIVFSRTPAATSLGNIGAVFHPTAYLLNLPAIQLAAAQGRPYSFYMEGIANNPVVGAIVEEVDQIRLKIAQAVGCQVFGLRDNPREAEWQAIMARVERDALNADPGLSAQERRRRRAELLRPIHDAVVSAQHWLAYTYGIERIPGESLASAIGRTPNFQSNSCPQQRYAEEDVPTGLVPFEALAQRFGIPCEPISRVIDLYSQLNQCDIRSSGRNLRDFSLEYLKDYLLGNLAHSRRERKWLELVS
jgi:opine dehydrogenase